jgi:hypothetical protein
VNRGARAYGHGRCTVYRGRRREKSLLWFYAEESRDNRKTKAVRQMARQLLLLPCTGVWVADRGPVYGRGVEREGVKAPRGSGWTRVYVYDYLHKRKGENACTWILQRVPLRKRLRETYNINTRCRERSVSVIWFCIVNTFRNSLMSCENLPLPLSVFA